MSFKTKLGGMTHAIADLLRPRAPEKAEDDEEENDLPTDTHTPARLGFWVLGVGFGGFLIWAAFAPLDEGVPTSGMVTIDTKRKAVQHLSGGIIKVVHVKEGQFVREGAPLLEIDDAVTQANLEGSRLRYYTLRATEDRLTAEQTGQKEISFHRDLLLARETDPLVANMLNNQERLFLSRRMSLEAEINAMEESISGYKAAIAGYQGLLEARRAQLRLLQEESEGLRGLVTDGYAPKNDLLALERTKAETLGSIADLQGNIERSHRGTAEVQLRITQRKQDFRKEIDTQLAEVNSQAQAEQERFESFRNDLARTVLRAPTDGQVVGFVTQTVGGVISPGQKVMDIVPQNEALLLETQVPPHLIDRVQPGSEADVRFSSFVHSPQLVVPGRVESVSADLLTHEQSGVSYYLARISVTPEGMKILGNRNMQAGMPAEVIIITGKRSLLVYLLRPLLKRLSVSMKEE
jgi:protease secretion system membrane fusion protein